ncbi:hypothetical protein LA080_009310 [Diaporthe eres]|uniref:Uncharacterized protein n=1 Tax=Diaporthe vaccinii TaxID=105482 RepID=A0ABR4E506_9PEZI|nr:hypothetical protein LA080_009310 [Diaporthe eres]
MSGEYSDASSSYWAPGWNFERWVHAEENDLATLPEGELIKIQDGLRHVLGEAGMSKLSRYMFDLEQEQKQQQEDNKKRTLEGDDKGLTASSSAEGTETLVFSPPNWLGIWRKHFNGQQWGFAAFRAACFSGSDVDEHRWTRSKTQVQRIVELPFERAIAQAKKEDSIIPDDFEAARAKFTIQWEEVPATQESTAANASSDLFRSEYAALRPSLGSGLSWDLFLWASPEAVESFEKEASNTDETSSLWRPRAPFLLAVAADRDPGLEPDHEQRIWLKPVFKVAAEALVESLIDVVDMGTPLQRVTRNVRGANELDGATGHQDQEQSKKEAEELDEFWWSMHPSPERLRKKRRRMEY